MLWEEMFEEGELTSKCAEDMKKAYHEIGTNRLPDSSEEDTRLRNVQSMMSRRHHALMREMERSERKWCRRRRMASFKCQFRIRCVEKFGAW